MNGFYSLFVPKQAAGANLVYFDLFNASGSGAHLIVHSVRAVVSGAVAVVGTLSVDLFLTRTTAVGTGGTAATRNGTDPTACTISSIDGHGVAPTQVTARLTPTGGATAGPVLEWTSVFTEETNAASYVPSIDLVVARPVSVPQGAGVRVVQGAVASVGNIGFNVVFELVPSA